MKVEFNNLFTHFVFTTLHREQLILECIRERVEKYITGIVNNNACHLYAIYANPEHMHFLVSRSPNISEESLANIVANSSARFINENKLCNPPRRIIFSGRAHVQHFPSLKPILTRFVNTF